MKNLLKSMMFALLGVFALSSCEDVPAPYGIPGQSGSDDDGSIIYSSKNLNTGWQVFALTDDNPWSLGNNYAMGTGYQDWESTGTKSNREVRGYLVSPAISTKGKDKVKFTFDDCLMYTNNDSQYAQHCKVLLSTDFDDDVEACNWAEVTDFTPTAAVSNYTFRNVGEIQLPEDFVNQEKVFFAFYFEAPASKSTTWELQNFKVEEGEATAPEPIVVETEGDGTAENPYTVADALAIISAGAQTSDQVYVKGIISQLGDKDGNDKPGNDFGNATYFISDDGTTDNQFEIFRGNGLGGVKITTEDYIKVGDNVVVCGVLTLYKDTPEMAQGSKIMMLNELTPEDNRPTDVGVPSGSGTAEDPYNVAAARELIKELQETTDSKTPYLSDEVYVKGTICTITTTGSNAFNSQYGNMTYWIADFDESGATLCTLEVYRGLYINGEKFTTGNEIKIGDEVIIKGKLQNFKGSYEFTTGSAIITINGEVPEIPDTPDTPGGDDGSSQTVEGNSITFSTMGYKNSQSLDGQTIIVGDATLTFSKANGGTAPAYYNTGNAMRMYGSNTLTINSNKTISKVEFKFADGNDSSSRPYYPTTDNSTIEPGDYDYSTHTWTGSTNNIVLTYTGKGGHFRMLGLTITYAE